MKRNLKRIKVISFLEANIVGGPAKTMIEFAKSASQENDDLPGVDLLITTFHRSGAPVEFIEAVRTAGLRLSDIPEKAAFDARILSEVRKAVSEYSPDIVQTSNIKSHFLVNILGLHRRYPWVAWHHGYTTTDLKMLIYNQLNRFTLRFADRVVVVCRAFIEQMTKIGVRPDRIAVQHNTIKPFIRPPEAQLRSLRSSLGLSQNAFVLLSVGRLSREKGHLDLVKAASLLSQESPQTDFRLVLLGDGPERASLEQVSRSLKIKEKIIFAGHQRDVSPYYAIADLCVLPSHSEGSPNVLLEAMAAGVPNLATSVGGVPEIAVHSENAWLVAKGDSLEMARGIIRLANDARLRTKIVEKGLAVTDQFTPAEYRRNVVRLYQDLLDKQRI
jgi:glycosyltransferase involved in cell wall biosynthesis